MKNLDYIPFALAVEIFSPHDLFQFNGWTKDVENNEHS
jgi:hypothetical protein